MEDLAQSRVLVAELMDEEIVARLAAAVQVDVKYGLSHEQLLEIIPAYHGIIVRSETQIDKSLLDAATNLRIVGRAGSGLDNIDVPSRHAEGRDRLQHAREQHHLGGRAHDGPTIGEQP